MSRVTGSKLPLAMACPASMVLSWIDPPPGPAAIRGTAIHAFLADVERYGVDEAIEMAPLEVRPFMRAINLEALPVHPRSILAEASFALDWAQRKARYLGQHLGRQYPELGPTEIALTTDLAGVGDRMVFVGDYKTGRSRYGRPGKFKQTLAAASAAMKVYGKDAATVGLIYIDEHGENFTTTDIVDDWDIEAFDNDLEIAMREVDKPIIDVRPGDHCHDLYCPAYRSCPAKSALVRHMPEHVAEIQRPGYLAPTRLARTWHQLQEMRRLLGLVEQEVRDLAMREPIDLENGEMLGLREMERETLDADVAVAVLTKYFGEHEARQCLDIEITKASIKNAAAAYRDRVLLEKGERVKMETKNKDGILDKIYAEIRECDGSTTKVTRNVTTYKKKD